MTGLVALLTGDPGFAALGGSRVYPVVLPQGAAGPGAPACTYRTVGGSSQPTLDWTSGMQRVRLELMFHGTSYGDSTGLRDAARAVLDNFCGHLAGGYYIQDCQWIQDLDDFDNEPRLYRCGAEYYLFFTL